MRYNITLELLKRVIVPIEADSEEEAQNKINLTLMHDGLEFIKEEVGSTTFDSIKIAQINDQNNTQLGSTV